MQQPGCQTWNGGDTNFKRGVRAPLAPPLATNLNAGRFNLDQCFSKWAESPLCGRFWEAKGRKKQKGDGVQNNKMGAKMLNH